MCPPIRQEVEAGVEDPQVGQFDPDPWWLMDGPSSGLEPPALW